MTKEEIIEWLNKDVTSEEYEKYIKNLSKEIELRDLTIDLMRKKLKSYRITIDELRLKVESLQIPKK